MSDLYLPHELRDEAWWAAYLGLSSALASGEGDGVAATVRTAYAALARELVRASHPDLAGAVAHELVTGDAPYACGARRSMEDGVRSLLTHDLGGLAAVARRDLRAEASAACGQDLPLLERLAPASDFETVREMRRSLLTASTADLVATYLEGLARHGGGLASMYGALRWHDGALEAVAVPAGGSLDQLVGLDEQLARLRSNTESLLARRDAHNVLLYGPRGSGKSTAVRGLLSQYESRGLRLVELPLEELRDLPQLLDRLRVRPQVFVLFVDDLAFEEGDAGYRPLRTLLEGGLSGRPDNVALYATSNRRHLLKERFRDRPDPLDDDVHRWDTQHEKLALADRFGLTITFPDAGQRRYLEVVHGLAERGGLESLDLDEAAIRFAEWGNGYSGRTAAQFIASLRQRVQ